MALAQGVKATRDPKTGKVVPDEMIQSGDPTGTGAHKCVFTIPYEFLPGLRLDTAGKLAMANTGATDSGGCQFLITVNVCPHGLAIPMFGVVVEVASKINILRSAVTGRRTG